MDQVRAKEIMARNMFGVEDAVRHFGVNPTRQQTAALSKIPWSEATLEQCRDLKDVVEDASRLDLQSTVARRNH